MNLRIALACLLCATALDAHAASTALDRTQALDPGPTGVEATRRVLADFHHQDQGEAGFGWWLRLPIAVRSRQVVDAGVRSWRNRLELLRDAQRHDAEACAVSGPAVLHDPQLGCELAVELQRFTTCVDPLPPARRDTLVQPLQAQVQARLQQQGRDCSPAAGSHQDSAHQASLATP